MGAFGAWFTAIVMALSLVVVLHQVGYDVSPAIGSAVHGVERFLGRPIL